MKSFLKILCLSAYIINFAALTVAAQCTGILQTVTYDTAIAGNGNDTHVFSLSKFNPATGTLVAAKITSLISINYGFTLQNVEGVPRDFAVSVGRYDNFSSTALSTPHTNLLSVPLGSFPLNPGDSVIRAPSTILSHYMQSDSLIYDMANFLGSGTIDYNYTPITYTNLTGSNVYYYAATASDSIRFSITYFYCNATVLPAGIIDFFAKKESVENIALSWKILNETVGRNYEIQKSKDGITFELVTSIPSLKGANDTGNYLYEYKITAEDKDKIYFRIKITDAAGAITYSENREINLDAFSGNLYLYPNPSANYINVDFNQPEVHNWNISIYASNGILLQSAQFQNTNLAYIPFKQQLPSGIYFMKATDVQNRKNYIKSFTIK